MWNHSILFTFLPAQDLVKEDEDQGPIHTKPGQDQANLRSPQGLQLRELVAL